MCYWKHISKRVIRHTIILGTDSNENKELFICFNKKVDISNMVIGKAYIHAASTIVGVTSLTTTKILSEFTILHL